MVRVEGRRLKAEGWKLKAEGGTLRVNAESEGEMNLGKPVSAEICPRRWHTRSFDLPHVVAQNAV